MDTCLSASMVCSPLYPPPLRSPLACNQRNQGAGRLHCMAILLGRPGLCEMAPVRGQHHVHPTNLRLLSGAGHDMTVKVGV